MILRDAYQALGISSSNFSNYQNRLLDDGEPDKMRITNAEEFIRSQSVEIADALAEFLPKNPPKSKPPPEPKAATSIKPPKSSSGSLKNVFEEIKAHGSDGGFEPHVTDRFIATQAPPGSRTKLEEMAERVERGEPTFNNEDTSYETIED